MATKHGKDQLLDYWDRAAREEAVNQCIIKGTNFYFLSEKDQTALLKEVEQEFLSLLTKAE